MILVGVVTKIGTILFIANGLRLISRLFLFILISTSFHFDLSLQLSVDVLQYLFSIFFDIYFGQVFILIV